MNACMKTSFAVAALAAGALWGGASSAAAFQNGDFSSGFAGWQGQANYAPVTPLATPNFDASSGAAVLTTTFDANGPYALHLFQTFDLQALTPSIAGLELSFAVSWSLDDATNGDAWSAQLIDQTDTNHFLAMTAGGTFDITGFSGRSVQLLFSLENMASNDDSLTIDNIAIAARQADVSVPVPGTLLLVGIGLAALRRRVF